jgi:ATP-dependent Clp protease protease subunit
MFKQGSNAAYGGRTETMKNKGISKFLSDLAGKEFASNSSNPQQYKKLSEKALGQRQLRREYNLNSLTSQLRHPQNKKAWTSSSNDSYNEFRDYYRKQTERSFMEEESKKVFVIINSFGGSVGNGITVHDALQFIKAGSLTLGLGVAASASSLVLAGGTIGERYVTEGCHTMIHQPESSLQGQASDIWIDSQEIMKIRLDVADIYSLSTYRPRHKILRDLDRDFYLNAPETISYGLADEIATNEVMHEIVEMTSKIWDVYDSKQQRLLESRESASSGSETQTQS